MSVVGVARVSARPHAAESNAVEVLSLCLAVQKCAKCHRSRGRCAVGSGGVRVCAWYGWTRLEALHVCTIGGWVVMVVVQGCFLWLHSATLA